MVQQRIAYFGVLAFAVIAAACSPNDAGIGTTVKAKLTADETLKAAPIEVGVQKKVVTLSGTVDTPAVRERAMAMARATDGVADVVDHMTIREQGSGHGMGPGRATMGPGMTEGMGHSVEGNRGSAVSRP